jgi:hypothetical protein
MINLLINLPFAQEMLLIYPGRKRVGLADVDSNPTHQKTQTVICNWNQKIKSV